MQDSTASAGAIDGFGLDCAGVVTEVGCDVNRFKVGNRVGALTSGAFTTSLVVPHALCFEIPDGKSFQETAGIPFAYGTAIHALVDKTRLDNGMVSD